MGSICRTPYLTKKLKKNLNENISLLLDILIFKRGSFQYNGLAVQIKDLEKSYDSANPVLNKVCMHVEKGRIYGLLGSSGCGKTTLLMCLLGQSKWDHGQVFLFGNKVSKRANGFSEKVRIGYMPQELSLHERLTPSEIIHLYGRLHEMPEAELHENCKMLLNLLNLNDYKFNRIYNLSGGQKRRVSLAIAMVHTPDLLILDEPTVGIDPLLRLSIWEHLYTLSMVHKVSIVVTTHYVEELRKSDRVGIMRNGRLAAEHDPNTLLSNYSTSLLEDVVLRVSKQEEVNGLNTNNFCMKSNNFLSSIKINYSNKIDNENDINFKRQHFTKIARLSRNNSIADNMDDRKAPSTWSNAMGWLRRTGIFTYYLALCICRQRLLMAMACFVPLFQLYSVLSVAGTEPKDLHLGIVNNEVPNWSRDCPWDLNSSCDPQKLGCTLLRHISSSEMIRLVEFETREEAVQHTTKGLSWGYIEIPQNFSDSMAKRVFEGRFAENNTLESSTLHMQLDMSEYFINFHIYQFLRVHVDSFVSLLETQCGFDLTLLKYPVQQRSPPVHGRMGTSVDDTTPVLALLMIMFEIASLLTPLTLIIEHEKGSLKRAQVARVGATQSMISNGIVCTTIGFVLSYVCLQFTTYVFQIRNIASNFVYFGFSLITTVYSAALGTLVAAASTDAKVCCLLLPLYFPIASMLIGSVSLRNSFPYWYQTFSYYFCPLVALTESFKSAVGRGATFTHPTVYPGIGITFISMVIVILLCLCFKRRL